MLGHVLLLWTRLGEVVVQLCLLAGLMLMGLFSQDELEKLTLPDINIGNKANSSDICHITHSVLTSLKKYGANCIPNTQKKT